MDKTKTDKLPLPKGPTDSGGGPSMTAKKTGNTESGKIDYEDMFFEKPEDGIEDEDLANWLFEYWGNLDTSVEKLRGLVEKMYTFSTSTKNLHKEMKVWCSELHQLTGRVQKRSDALKSYIDKSSERVTELSSSLLEISSTSFRGAVTTIDKGVGTENELVLGNKTSDEHDTRQQTSISIEQDQAHATGRRVKITEDRKKKAKMKHTNITPSNISTESKAGTQKTDKPRKGPSKRRNMNDTLLIKPSGASSYAEVVKKLKGNIDVNVLEVNIKTMRKTDKGDLILHIGNGAKQTEATERLKTAIVEVLGKEAELEHKQYTATVDIKDLEADTSEEEVREAVSKATGVIPTSINLLPSWGGSKMATVRIIQREATKLAKMGRIVVGLVRCRIKLRQPITRCFRCHGYGHIKTACKGKDRRDQCMTCGQTDHKAKDCMAPPRCVHCEDIEQDGSHYPGSARCKAAQEARRKNSN